MKKRILVFCLAASILLSCTACKPTEELPTEPEQSELSVFELTLSDEIKAQIDEAWNNSKYAQNSTPLPPGGRLWDCIEDGYIYASYGYARYYGTYGNSVVWFEGGPDMAESSKTDFILAGIRFYFDGICHFYVYTDGSLCEMAEAYENGLLTEADVAMIAKRHKEYQHNAQNRCIDLDEEGRSVFDLYMPEQMKRQIGRGLVEAGYIEEAVWAEYKDGIVFSDGIRFYGQTGSSLVLFVPQEGGEPMSLWIGPGKFDHPTAGVLLIYQFGYYSDFREVYVELGKYLYSNEFVNQLASRHKEIDQVLYPELYS